MSAERLNSELSDDDLDKVVGGALSLGLVKNLASVFGWSPKQVDQVLGRGDVPYTGGGGGSDNLADDGRE